MIRKERFVLSGWILVVALVLTAPSARADMYVVGEGGITTHEVPWYDQSSAYNVGVGAVGPRHMFGVEASYVSLGSGAILAAPFGSISMYGYNLSTFFQVPAGPLVYGVKLGLYSMNAFDSGYGLSVGSSGVSWGLYLGYQPSDSMLLFWDAEGFNNVDTPVDGPETPTLITLGARFYFGGRSRGYRRS